MRTGYNRKQRGSAMLADNFVDRTSEVQVDEIGVYPIRHSLCSLCHSIRVSPEQLNSQRALAILKEKHVSGMFVPMKDSIGRNKFRDEHVSPLLFTQTTKNRICYTGHRRQVQRLIILKPR